MKKEFYEVKVEGKVFQSSFNFEGLKECQLFIKNNGKPNKRYVIKYKEIK